MTADDLLSTTTTGGTPGKGTNLVMVIDVSGSIVGKESALNSAIQALVNGLPENSQVGVVTFNENASASEIFTKESISGLSFSGVANAGTTMSTGINAAKNLLNGSGWSENDNSKAMVIISDFDIDDYADAINNAKTAKGSGIAVYSVNFGVDSVQEADDTAFSQDNRQKAIYNVTRYISSQYPSASAENNSMFGMFNQANVTTGNENTSASYVFGARGGNWSDIFAEIKASEGITEESSLPMTNVVITDTLSDYVELVNLDGAANYGVSLDTTDTNVSIKDVTLSGDGKTVTVSLEGKLTDEAVYTVKIPVKPSEKAIAETNQSAVAVQSYYSNTDAGMSYEYDADHTGSVTYKEKPTILVARQVTLTYDDNVADEEIDVPEAASAAVVTDESADNYNKAEFTIGSDPSREGYTFLGWNTDQGAAEADSAYAAGSKVNLGANTTLYAVWKQNTTTYTLKYDANAGEDTVTVPEDDTYTGTEDSHAFTVSKDKPARTGYTFLGWTAPAEVTVGEDGKFTMPEKNVEFTGTWAFTPTPVEKYTVTYTDGVDGEEVFADQVTADLESGTTTPSFDGTPSREGYTFKGWTPDLAETVTANATYTATWEAVPVEPDPDTYTVTTKEKGHTYEIYQIFTGDLTQNDEGKDVLVNLVWGENGNGTQGEAVDQTTIDALKAVVNETLDKAKLAEIEKTVVLTDPYRTIESEDGSTVSASDLPAGYYLITRRRMGSN